MEVSDQPPTVRSLVGPWSQSEYDGEEKKFVSLPVIE
jgi:hypothetical protein